MLVQFVNDFMSAMSLLYLGEFISVEYLVLYG